MDERDAFRALARPELEAAVVERRSVIDRLETEWLAMVAEPDRKRAEDASVMESLATWQAHRCRLSPGEAAAKVAPARSLAAMPRTAAAVAVGGPEAP